MFDVLDAISRETRRRLFFDDRHICGPACAAERDQGGPVNLGRPADQTTPAAVPCRCGGVMRPGLVHYCRGRA